MTDIIRNMSRVEVSDELLQQIDMQDLFDNFKKNYDKLGEFKKTKDKHEQRGVVKKLWHAISFDKTMENAQFDATEIQSEFSKILGQLTVVNIALSKQLNNQQKQLLDQQDKIKKQTTEIESQTKILNDQQNELESQNHELNELVREYFKLKGLTQECAKKLIAIAHEIEVTKDRLLKSVDEKIQSSQQWVLKQQNIVDNKIQLLEDNVSTKFVNLLESVRNQQAASNKQMMNEVSLNIDTLEMNVNKKLQDAIDEYKSLTYILTTEQVRVNDSVTNINNDLNMLKDGFNNIKDDLNLYLSITTKKIKNLSMVFGVTTLILLSSVIYLFAH